MIVFTCRRGFHFLLLAAMISGCQAPLRSPVSSRHETVTIPTYEWGPHDINPHFQPTGGMSIYPYPMQDNLGREKGDKTYDALVIENEYLRVTVLPELGGRVYSVFDKVAGREMFYRNKVVKPGLIGLAGAWISGGIEFNTGPLGHTVTAVYPTACRFVEHADGSRSIAIGHTDRIYRTQWMAEVRLRPGRRCLEERIRLYNPNSTPQWYYFWNCTAVPNTDGTRFIYPMSLGTDHGYTTFFPWPVHDDKDYSWSKHYEAPTGPFAYECDQDFFGSYDHDLDYGLVAVANHHQVKGKKGWTWGRGEDGIVAMSTLTDDGSWYNEVQTGPLQTQVDVAPFGPHQTFEWQEWWYPVHDLDGFEFATRDVAVNVFPQVPFNGEAREPVREIRLAATARFDEAYLTVSKDSRALLHRTLRLVPEEPTRLELPEPVQAPIHIELWAAGRLLAAFTHPLPLPKRTPPEKPAEGDSASDLWRDGIRAQSNGNIAAARAKFEEAIKKQVDFIAAVKSLATMELDSGLYEQAAKRLEAALKVTPEDGFLHYWRAEAALGMDDDGRALDEAWKAARLAETTAIGLNLAAQVYIRQQQWAQAEETLRQALRHDRQDVSSWTLLARVYYQSGHLDLAADACRQALARDPLDPHAATMIVYLDESTFEQLAGVVNDAQVWLEVSARLIRLRCYEEAERAVCRVLPGPDIRRRGPAYWLNQYFRDYASHRWEFVGFTHAWPSRHVPPGIDYEWPFRVEEIAIFQDAVKRDPEDARAWYLLGNVLFSKHRHAEARQAWDQAASLGFDYSVLYRNIGMARDLLDKDLSGAVAAYERAHALNPHDQPVLRDLARLYRRQERWADAIALLEKSLTEPIHRSDVTEELVRAYEHENQLDKAAALLDARTFNQWEGQQSLQQIYETVHRKLGQAAMERQDFTAAVREFERALAYPRNLGVGKPKGKSQADGLKLLEEARAAAAAPAVR